MPYCAFFNFLCPASVCFFAALSFFSVSCSTLNDLKFHIRLRRDSLSLLLISFYFMSSHVFTCLMFPVCSSPICFSERCSALLSFFSMCFLSLLAFFVPPFYSQKSGNCTLDGAGPVCLCPLVCCLMFCSVFFFRRGLHVSAVLASLFRLLLALHLRLWPSALPIIRPSSYAKVLSSNSLSCRHAP